MCKIKEKEKTEQINENGITTSISMHKIKWHIYDVMLNNAHEMKNANDLITGCNVKLITNYNKIK